MSSTAALYASDLLCVPTSCMTPLCGCSGGLSHRGSLTSSVSFYVTVGRVGHSRVWELPISNDNVEPIPPIVPPRVGLAIWCPRPTAGCLKSSSSHIKARAWFLEPSAGNPETNLSAAGASTYMRRSTKKRLEHGSGSMHLSNMRAGPSEAFSMIKVISGKALYVV